MNNSNRALRTLFYFTTEIGNFPYNDFEKEYNFKEMNLIKKRIRNKEIQRQINTSLGSTHSLFRIYT